MGLQRRKSQVFIFASLLVQQSTLRSELMACQKPLYRATEGTGYIFPVIARVPLQHHFKMFLSLLRSLQFLCYYLEIMLGFYFLGTYA